MHFGAQTPKLQDKIVLLNEREGFTHRPQSLLPTYTYVKAGSILNANQRPSD
jgi:hypothetical protein